ncbi:MAG: hypothetical protein MJ240_02740 [Kiritimatiellae bacterium]|nr:hypothetical protein [Kiritimatiellia bacterium]
MTKNIKKMLATALVLLGVAVVGAAQDDALIAFSTKGPDSYADGTPVLEGEVYAIVWARNGSTFQGVDLNGQVVDAANNEVIVALPLAKAKRNGDVHCPLTLFQIDASFAAAHADGEFSLVLFDTRVADGQGGLKVSGNAHQVQGWGEVAKSRVKAIGASLVALTNVGDANGTIAANATAVPADETIAQPKITGISVANGFVKLTVACTDPRLLYNVAAGDAPNRLTNRHAAPAPIQGGKVRMREVIVVLPIRDDQKFFKIVRN